jgi:hypothetical protein
MSGRLGMPPYTQLRRRRRARRARNSTEEPRTKFPGRTLAVGCTGSPAATQIEAVIIRNGLSTRETARAITRPTTAAGRCAGAVAELDATRRTLTLAGRGVQGLARGTAGDTASVARHLPAGAPALAGVWVERPAARAVGYAASAAAGLAFGAAAHLVVPPPYAVLGAALAVPAAPATETPAIVVVRQGHPRHGGQRGPKEGPPIHLRALPLESVPVASPFASSSKERSVVCVAIGSSLPDMTGLVSPAELRNVA